MNGDVTVRPADTDDRQYLESLLGANDLPTADLQSSAATFVVAVDGGDRVGVGGLAVHGTAGLLRSVAVEDHARGEGVGSAVCDALERRAVEAGVETLYLLTTTAAAFFADRGYEAVGRDAVPAPIRETAEFTDLCPSSATCLARSLSARR